MDNSSYEIGYDFVNKFPDETVEEVLPAVFDRTTNTFRIKRVNIGWALKKSYTIAYNEKKPVEQLADGESIYDRRIRKLCAGALRCLSLQCKRPEGVKDQRPPTKGKDSYGYSKRFECPYWKAPLEKVPCGVPVTFTFRVNDSRREDRGSTVTMRQEITETKKHTHTIYNSLHLDRYEKRELKKMVKTRPNITAAAAISGIDPYTGEITKSARKINNLMANHGRTKYEVRRSKIQQDLYTTKEDAVAAFQDLDEKYPHFMDSAQILPSKFFVSFCSPEMLQCNLPFADRSIVTDVTLKAVPEGYYYLCSSVIYVKQLQKHVVFYQAIIKSNSAQVFKQYFVALFRKFDIKLERFLGAIMDFSAAQREGFILALREVFDVKQHNALPFLKGCYMHWMQSVRRLSTNHQVVKPDDIDLFLKLVHRFRATSNAIEFYRTGQEILSKFPNSKKWLQWWLQPGVSSMIFRCKSLMKKELRQHKSRTSNAIEAFHSALYKLMPEKRQPVATSLRLLLQVAEYHGMMMLDLYENNIRPHYGNNQKKTTAKKYATLYEINDGRAPDNNAALFGSKKRKQQVVIIGDEENGKHKKAKKLETRGTDLNAAINEHLDEVIEIEQNCPKIDDIADGNISHERFFLELLSDSDGENDEADDRYHRTENLENDIKDMFKGAGVSVEDVVVNSDESFESSVIDLVSSSSSCSSSSPIMKTKSEPTASKMTAPTDSDFSLSSSSSNLPCLASNDKHIDPIIQSIQKSTSATIIDLFSPPMLPEILASVAIEPIASSSATTADQPSLENDSSTAAGFLLPQKITSFLQKYQWLVKDYQNNHPDSHPSLPVPTYIVSNESNSCFIDAFFELLFNAALPFVDMSFADENNAYDCLLMNAFESYSQQSPSGIRAATSTVRHFVWNMTEYKLVSGVRQLVKSFPKGRQGDILDLASMVLERLSSVFASKVCTFPSLQCERKVPCSMEKAHAYARDDFFSFIYMLPTNVINEMIDCRGVFNEAALDTKFNDLFREKVLEEHQKGRCNAPGCDGISTSYRSLPQDNQFPKFMFVQDGANFVLGKTAGNNVYMPTYIHVLQNVKYKLRGRIYSTSFDGVHFYTRCYKTIDGIVYLVDIDNWQQQQMKALTSDLDVAERLLKDISNTVYACYKRE